MFLCFETRHRFATNMSHHIAKSIEYNTTVSLPMMNHQELLLGNPFITKGYSDDKEFIGTMVDSEGWFKTGDLCYFDNECFLFVLDWLKELINLYKVYQVTYIL